MTRRTAALAALALATTACTAPAADPATKERAPLYLITPLPLLFGEGFGLGFATADVIAGLERRYTLRPVDLPSQVPAGAALLMAQPRALPAEELVALDRWVRGGGRLVLLADPLLEWPSERALGDRLRPPVQFADTGLLQHWGLRLDAPDERGLVRVGAGEDAFVTQSPGRVRTGGACTLAERAVVANCIIGTGRATIIADADWIDAPRMAGLAGTPVDPASRIIAALDSPTAH